MAATDRRVHALTIATTTGNRAIHTTLICSTLALLWRIVLLAVCLAWPGLLAWMIIVINHQNQTPQLPDFSLVSVSSTVRNIIESKHQVTMDLNVSFGVHNPNKASMVFHDMKALAFQHGDGDVLPGGLSINNATNDSELLGKRWSTEWFALRNTKAAIDALVDYEGDVRKSSGKALGFRFGLRGDVLYKGKINWSNQQKIPIKVVCDAVDVLFSSNINANATRAVALEPTVCHAYGLWGEIRKKLETSILVLDILLILSFGFCCATIFLYCRSRWDDPIY